MYLLLGTGLFFTLYLKFPQIRYFRHAFRMVSGKYDEKGAKGDTTHFRALTTALSGTVGTGNIAGVALAIHLGGPAALFWMLVTAMLGMTTKFVEVTLSHKYREFTEDGSGRRRTDVLHEEPPEHEMDGRAVRAGHHHFLFRHGQYAADQQHRQFHALGFRHPSGRNRAGAGHPACHDHPGRHQAHRGNHLEARATDGRGVFLRRPVGHFRQHRKYCDHRLAAIAGDVFTGSSATGGFLGATLAFAFNRGVNRGLFSNEAGQGSAPIAHAAAKADHPVSEGMVAILEPFIDTIIICMLTGMVLLSSGVWNEKHQNLFQRTDMVILDGTYDESRRGSPRRSCSVF